jgi:hypothetical protein
VVVALLAPAAAAAADRPPPAVKPTAERRLELPDVQKVSENEFSVRIRLNLPDTRRFVFAHDGARVVGHDPGMRRLETWDATTGKSGGRFGKFDNEGLLVPHPIRPLVLTAEWNLSDGVPVTLWDVGKQAAVRDLDEGVNTAVFVAGALCPDGRTVWLWDRYGPDGLSGPIAPPANAVQLTPLVAPPVGAFGGDPPAPPPGGIKVWNVETGEEVRTLPIPAPLPDVPYGEAGGRLLAFAPSGRWVAAVTGRRVLVLEAATGKMRADLGVLPRSVGSADGRPPPSAGATAAAVSGDGRQVLIGCADGVVRRWAVRDGRELPPLAGHRGPVRAVWCSADGRAAKTMVGDRVLEWDLTAPAADWAPPADAPAADLAALADRLGSNDPVAAYEAAATLAAHPAKVPDLIRARVAPVRPADPAELAALVRDVASPDYNTRRRAAGGLRQIGEAAAAALEGHHVTPGTPGTRIAAELRQKAWTPELVRAVRAVELLERVGTPEARKVLAELAGGAPGTTLTRVAAEAAARVAARKPPAALPDDPAGLWAELASADAARAYRAAVTLAARPAAATALLRDKLAACPARDGLDPARVGKLIAALGADDFAEREAAGMALAGYGKAAEPAMRAAVGKSDSPEVRDRLAVLLKNPADPLVAADAVHAGRAMEVLEMIGTPDARAALEAAGKGAKSEWFRDAAAAAAARVRK